MAACGGVGSFNGVGDVFAALIGCCCAGWELGDGWLVWSLVLIGPVRSGFVMESSSCGLLPLLDGIGCDASLGSCRAAELSCERGACSLIVLGDDCAAAGFTVAVVETSLAGGELSWDALVATADCRREKRSGVISLESVGTVEIDPLTAGTLDGV